MPCKCLYCTKRGYSGPKNIKWSDEAPAETSQVETEHLEAMEEEMSSSDHESEDGYGGGDPMEYSPHTTPPPSTTDTSTIASSSPNDAFITPGIVNVSHHPIVETAGVGIGPFERVGLPFSANSDQSHPFKTDTAGSILLSNGSHDASPIKINVTSPLSPSPKTHDEFEDTKPLSQSSAHNGSTVAKKDEHWLTPRRRSASLTEMESTDAVLAPFFIPPLAVFRPPPGYSTESSPSSESNSPIQPPPSSDRLVEGESSPITGSGSAKRKFLFPETENKIPRVSSSHRTPHPIPESKQAKLRRANADRSRPGEIVWCTAGASVLGIREERTFARWPALVVSDAWCKHYVPGWSAPVEDEAVESSSMGAPKHYTLIPLPVHPKKGGEDGTPGFRPIQIPGDHVLPFLVTTLPAEQPSVVFNCAVVQAIGVAGSYEVLEGEGRVKMERREEGDMQNGKGELGGGGMIFGADGADKSPSPSAGGPIMTLRVGVEIIQIGDRIRCMRRIPITDQSRGRYELRRSGVEKFMEVTKIERDDKGVIYLFGYTVSDIAGPVVSGGGAGAGGSVRGARGGGEGRPALKRVHVEDVVGRMYSRAALEEGVVVFGESERVWEEMGVPEGGRRKEPRDIAKCRRRRKPNVV
ncbi:hypothetical protein HDV00_008322 [Rhizophlyctis rosea]|nr:hypothetical protein HDV00_008322 [Rhizophlyctis rosea]